MHRLILLMIVIFLSGCSTAVPEFKKEEVCTHESMKYLRNPRNRTKRALENSHLVTQLSASSQQMQSCYEEFKDRTGYEEFNTCMVVGVDESGYLEFFNFGSNQIPLDEQFLSCAHRVTRSIPYQNYGQNYILIQSYKFFVSAE